MKNTSAILVSAILVALLFASSVAAYVEFSESMYQDEKYESRSNCVLSAAPVDKEKVVFVEPQETVKRKPGIIPFFSFLPRSYHYQTTTYTDFYSADAVVKTKGTCCNAATKVVAYDYDQDFNSVEDDGRYPAFIY